MSTAVLVMGVSASGKTVVGSALAEKLGWTFVDADDHHPAANVEKMSAGVPLTDTDRAPWLDTLNGIIRDHQERDDDLVLACSALKRAYREQLAEGVDDLRVVLLDIAPDVAVERIHDRRGHFMPSALLDSQYATLERPDETEICSDSGITSVLVVDAARPVDALVDELVEKLT